MNEDRVKALADQAAEGASAEGASDPVCVPAAEWFALLDAIYDVEDSAPGDGG